MGSVDLGSGEAPGEPVHAANEEPASDEGPEPRRARHFWLALIAVAGLGLLLRLGYVLQVGQHIVLRGDPLSYHLHGQQISSGAGYLQSQRYAATGEAVASAWFPPGHPTLLALLDGLGIDSVSGQKTAMAFVGTGTVILIGLIARRLAGPTVGLVAAAIAAASPVLIVADGALGTETLYMFLVAAILLQLYVMADQDDPRPVRWVLLGGSVALAAYTRSEAVLLFFFLVVPLTFRWCWSWRRRALRAGMAAATLILVLSPWLVRNYATFDGFIPISTNGSATIGGANCHRTYYGDARGRFAQSCFDGIGTETEGGSAPAAPNTHSREFAAEARQRGLEFARANAAAVPSTAAVRVLRTWWVYDAADQIRSEGFLENRNLEWLRWGYRLHLALLALGAAGSVVLARERLRAWPLWSTLAMVSVVSALIYGNMRFRAAAEPAIVILGAAGAVALGRAWASRPPRMSLGRESPAGPRASERTRRRVLIATLTVLLLVGVTPAVASVGVWPDRVVADTFDRHAVRAPLGRADTGAEWEAVRGRWGAEQGRARVVDAALPSPGLAVVDTGFADGRVAVTIEDPTAGSGLVVRYGDPDHYWALVADPVARAWAVTKTVQGRIESMGHVAPLGAGPTRLEVALSGSRMQFDVGGVAGDEIVDPDLSGATGAGLIASGDQTRTRWDDFEADPAADDRPDLDVPELSLGRVDGGRAERTSEGSWSVESGAAGVAEPPAEGVPLALFDTTVSDVRFGATLTDIEPGAGLVFRYAGAADHWLVAARPEFATWSVDKVVDGAVTRVGSVGPLTLDPERTRLEVSVFRDRIQFFVNGRQAATYYDLTHADATVVGLLGADTVGPGQTRWSDLEATPEGHRTD